MPPRPVMRRPVFLDLRVIRLPVNALVSILHRLSGLVLIFALPFWAWLLGESLSGEPGYARSLAVLHSWGAWVALFSLAALAHHFFAGLRHLAMDVHWGLGRDASRWSAWAVLVLDGVALPLLWWGVVA